MIRLHLRGHLWLGHPSFVLVSICSVVTIAIQPVWADQAAFDNHAATIRPANRNASAETRKLQELEDHGVVVLWRPYNESTNSRKWWCLQPADQFKALYRHTFDYLTREKGLDNLVWVYDGKPGGKNELNLSHYPGDDYVDVVGFTMNWDSGPVAQPNHPYPKKVFGCVEFNHRFDKNKFSYLDTPRDYDYSRKFAWMRDHLPYASFFMSWDRLSGPYGSGTPQSIKAMYNDPAVANRGEINWRGHDVGTKKE